ncbi:hypothetical protein C8R43DRAFT_956716 [Mycena crocata]|nr:hypothetical protein C8R43DRAFT_956716 [Mycena crocata]
MSVRPRRASRKKPVALESDEDPSVEEREEYAPSGNEDDSVSESDAFSDEPVGKRHKTAKGKSDGVKGWHPWRRADTKGKGKGRGGSIQGALKDIVKMPMDMLGEIFRNLEPFELIKLASVNKDYCSHLWSADMSFVWKAARSNIEGDPVPAPPPPTDMSEVTWAYLLLYMPKEICFECSKAGTKMINIVFTFCQRICLACCKEKLLRKEPQNPVSQRRFDDIVFDLVPYTIYLFNLFLCLSASQMPSFSDGGYFGGWGRQNKWSYWLPDLESMQNKVTKFKQTLKTGGPSAGKEYMESWVDDKSDQKDGINMEKKEEHYKAIVNHLQALSYSSSQASTYFNSHRFTPYTHRILAWDNIWPDILVQLDVNRAQRAQNQHQRDMAALYNWHFLKSLTPIQLFFVPPELFPQHSIRAFRCPEQPQLPGVEQLIVAGPDPGVSPARSVAVSLFEFFTCISKPTFPSLLEAFGLSRSKFGSVGVMGRANSTRLASSDQVVMSWPHCLTSPHTTATLSPGQFNELIMSQFFTSTSIWALDRMDAIAQAASLPITLPPSIAWIRKVFDLATAVFIVDTWKTSGSCYHNWAYQWNHDWPALKPVSPLLSNNKVVFIGCNIMHLAKPNPEIMIYSERSADAVMHYLRNDSHAIQPFWSRVLSVECASFSLDKDGSLPRQHHRWVCNDCADFNLGHYRHHNKYDITLNHVSTMPENVPLQ